MKCNIEEFKLSQYLDRGLTGNEILFMKNHILNCIDCQNRIENLKEIDNIIQKGDISGKAKFDKHRLRKNIMDNIGDLPKIQI